MQLRRLEELVDSRADAIFAVDSDGSNVACNPAEEALFNKSAKEVLGHRCESIIKGED